MKKKRPRSGERKYAFENRDAKSKNLGRKPFISTKHLIFYIKIVGKLHSPKSSKFGKLYRFQYKNFPSVFYFCLPSHQCEQHIQYDSKFPFARSPLLFFLRFIFCCCKKNLLFIQKALYYRTCTEISVYFFFFRQTAKKNQKKKTKMYSISQNTFICLSDSLNCAV